MRILMAARFTVKEQPVGGVQSWIEAIKTQLEAMRHEVVTWGRDNPVQPSGRFDLGIFAHWCETGQHAALCDKTISVSHGIIEPERPGNAERVLFTSEGVRDHWNQSGDIIRQPIDTDFWSPAKTQRIYLTRFSYRAGLVFAIKLAGDMGLTYRHVKQATPRQARDILRQSACVLATGRAALEAMAVGVPVVICDDRSTYQQPLLDTDTLGSMGRNYSGRGGIAPTRENLKAAIESAIKSGSLRDHVLENHDAEQIALQLTDGLV